MTSATTDSYLTRARGPRAGAELLCPSCGGLLALGWLPGPDAATALGATLRCLLCRVLVPVDTAPAEPAPAPDASAVLFCSTWRLLAPDAA